MTGKARSSLLSLAIIAVLVFGAVSPTIVYADDGNPPDTSPTEASSVCTTNDDCPSSEGVTDPTSNDADVAAQATEPPVEATAEATSTPDETTAEATPVESEATALPATEEAAPVGEESTPVPDSSVLEQVPENTTVTVLDAQGQSQPLATQDAAAAIATTSDPIWCPQGQAPIPGANGCTTSFNSFDALLTFLSGNAVYQGAGTIYVQQGAYNGGEASIDFNSPTYDLSNIRSFDLTITGGWDTASNTLDPASTSNFTIPIMIGTGGNPWGGSLSINNITINKTAGTGLTLHTQNDITIMNVTVTNSVNGAGAELNAGGDVVIRDSRFDRNKTAGAIIRANSAAIRDSSFSNPHDGRVQNTGLDIVTNGDVALLGVTANENRQAGANINAGGRVAISTSVFSGTKSIRGEGGPNETFLGYGLQVVSPSTIDLEGVTANDNFLWGASLQAGGDVAISNSFFNANTTESPGFIDDTGLLVTSGGNVALRNVEANDNRLIGAKIDAVGEVAVRDSSFSRNNGVILSSGGAPTFYGYGLQVITQGRIAVRSVTASNNTLFGAHLEAGQDVLIIDSNFSNQTSGSTTDQTGKGLEVIAGTDVNLINVILDNNQTFGGNLKAGGNISLDGVTATNNGLNGLDVQGNCTTVVVTNGTYSNNGGYGLSVLNAALNQVGSPVFAGNGAGDIFHDMGTCVAPTGGTTGGTASGNSTGPGSVTSEPAQAALQNNSTQVSLQQGANPVGGNEGSLPASDLGSGKVTLNSFLASIAATDGGSHLSIFVGNYAYLYSNSELHIIVFSPSSNSLAMGGQ